MDAKKLKSVLDEHKKWLEGNGGVRANLSMVDLRRADLRWANLSGADLRRANLREADLSETDLREADLSGADLSGANLSETDLRRANLSRANLREADLSETDLRRANLSGANLQQTRGLIYAQCSFSNHGECGRMLTGVIIDNKEAYFCGCFKGSLDDLKNYINKGDVKYKKSRTIAMKFVSARLKEAVMGEK